MTKDMLRGAGIRWGMVLFKVPLLCYTIANIYFILPQGAVAARAWLELLLLGNLLVAYGAGWCLEMLLPRGRQWNISAMGKWVLPAAVAVGILVAQVDALSLTLLPLLVPEGIPSGTVVVPGEAAVSLHSAVAGLFAGYTLLIGIGRHSAAGGSGPAERFAAVIGRVMGTGCVLLAVLPVFVGTALALENFEGNYDLPVLVFLTFAIMVINYVLSATVGRITARIAEPRLTICSGFELWCVSVGMAIFGGWLIALLDNILVFTPDLQMHSSLVSLIGGSAMLAIIEGIPGGYAVGVVVVALLFWRRSRLQREMTQGKAELHHSSGEHPLVRRV